MIEFGERFKSILLITGLGIAIGWFAILRSNRQSSKKDEQKERKKEEKEEDKETEIVKGREVKASIKEDEGNVDEAMKVEGVVIGGREGSTVAGHLIEKVCTDNCLTITGNLMEIKIQSRPQLEDGQMTKVDFTMPTESINNILPKTADEIRAFQELTLKKPQQLNRSPASRRIEAPKSIPFGKQPIDTPPDHQPHSLPHSVPCTPPGTPVNSPYPHLEDASGNQSIFTDSSFDDGCFETLHSTAKMDVIGENLSKVKLELNNMVRFFEHVSIPNATSDNIHAITYPDSSPSSASQVSHQNSSQDLLEDFDNTNTGSFYFDESWSHLSKDLKTNASNITSLDVMPSYSELKRIEEWDLDETNEYLTSPRMPLCLPNTTPNTTTHHTTPNTTIQHTIPTTTNHHTIPTTTNHHTTPTRSCASESSLPHPTNPINQKSLSLCEFNSNILSSIQSSTSQSPIHQSSYHQSPIHQSSTSQSPIHHSTPVSVQPLEFENSQSQVSDEDIIT